MRLAAAALVLVSHAWPLSGIGDAEPLAALTGGAHSLGSVAVAVFLSVSGYLVTGSWLDDPAPGRFLAKRLLRLVPALAAVVLLEVLVLGPLLGVLPVRAYFAQPATWEHFATVLIYPVRYVLPGLFAGNPYPDVVNGSLWTLRLEFTLYLMLLALGVAGWLARPRILPLLLAGLVAADLAMAADLVRGLPGQVPVFTANAICFFAGSALRLYPVRRSARWGLVLGLAWLASAGSPLFRPLGYLAVPYVTILVGAAPAAHALARRGAADLSYGLYLVAFPIQQSLMAVLGPAVLPLPLFIVASLALALPLAWVSWHCVEQPALRLKPRPGFRGAAGMVSER